MFFPERPWPEGSRLVPPGGVGGTTALLNASPDQACASRLPARPCIFACRNGLIPCIPGQKCHPSQAIPGHSVHSRHTPWHAKHHACHDHFRISMQAHPPHCGYNLDPCGRHSGNNGGIWALGMRAVEGHALLSLCRDVCCPHPQCMPPLLPPVWRTRRGWLG